MDLKKQLAIVYVRTKFKLLSTFSKRKAAASAFTLFCTPQKRTLKPLPEIFQQSEKIQFSFRSHQITGFRWNASSSKKALILHGFESSVVNFEQYITPLIQKGYEVLAFDAPAHGVSSGTTITVELYKDLVIHISNTYGPVQAYIAHSFGGLTLGLALEEIKTDAADKVVLIAPVAEMTYAVKQFFQLLKLDTDVQLAFEKIIIQIGGHRSDWYSWNRMADHIQAKVLYVQDKDDLLTPFQVMEPIMRKNLPNFHFRISEGLGHRKIYRDEQTVKAIIDFL